MKPKIYVTRRLPEPALMKLRENCQIEIWDHETPPTYEEILHRIMDKEGLLCLLTDRIDENLMDAAPNLKVISQCAVGFDNIDVDAATKRGIAVGNTPGVLTEATADFAFSLMLASSRRIVEAMDYVRDGKWTTWGLTVLMGQQVYGATLGIIGMGRIGRALAERARGFDMKILYFDKSQQTELERKFLLKFRSFEEVMRESDFISLHVNLTPETTGMIDNQAFRLMKPNAILINTARGPIVDSEALYTALKQGKIAGAALDVTDPEPLPVDHPLLSLPNLIVTPHIASATVVTRSKMAMMAVENLVAGVAGKKLPYQVG